MSSWQCMDETPADVNLATALKIDSYSINTKWVMFEYQVPIHTCFVHSLFISLSVEPASFSVSLLFTVSTNYPWSWWNIASDHTGCISQLCLISPQLNQTTGSHYSPDLTVMPRSNGQEDCPLVISPWIKHGTTCPSDQDEWRMEHGVILNVLFWVK